MMELVKCENLTKLWHVNTKTRKIDKVMAVKR